MAEITEREQAWRKYAAESMYGRKSQQDIFNAGWDAAQHSYTTKIGTHEHGNQQSESD